MKNIKFILLLAAILSFSCSSRKVIITENDIPEGRFYLNNAIKPFTGECLIYYSDNKTLKEVIHFKNGLLSGKHFSYYKNGQIKRSGVYRNGLLNGKWVGYDLNGNQIYILEYTNDSISNKSVA